MDAFEFLNTETAKLPKDRSINNGKTFIDFLTLEFYTFYKELSQISGTDWLSQEILKNLSFIEECSKATINALEKYFMGLPDESYQCLAEWINKNYGFFSHLRTINMKKEDFEDTYPLYRMRVNNEPIILRSEMFHIPFEQRHKVSTQRYSIPGFPCLYMGSTTYDCWKELGCPKLDNVYFVRLRPTRDINLIDLTYIPSLMSTSANIDFIKQTQKKELKDFILYQILFWPLKCACMIKTLYNEAPFKPEYIIPQLLLQYVKKDRDFDGVRYYSTCFDHQGNYFTGINYAIPVKTNGSIGHCNDMKSLFDMTEVISWQLLSANKPRLSSLLSHRELKNQDVINFVQGQPESYRDTIFGYMDTYGLKIDAKPL